MNPAGTANARDLEQELGWFARLLDTRFKLYFGHETPCQNVFEVTRPISAARPRLTRFSCNGTSFLSPNALPWSSA